MPPSVRTRTRLTLKDKMDLIKDSDSMNVNELCNKYEMCASGVYKLLKQKNQILRDYLAAQNTKSKQKPRKSIHDKVNTAVYNWFVQARAKNLPIPGSLLQEKARALAENLADFDFRASNGWLESFKTRHQLTFGAVSGEGNDVDQNVVANWIERIPELIGEYDIKDVANCDETALFFRAIPTKSLRLKGEKCSGGKLSKERLTVMHCVFADGSFETPLVIGKANNPRCFKSIDKNLLPVTWKFNRKAWMTGSIMEEWLINLNAKMARKNRKICLLLDNATSHPNMTLSNIKLIFLPPKTTASLQPLDQGIIHSFKMHYRKRILSHLIHKMDGAHNASQLTATITCLDAIYWISEATKAISKSCVVNCFKKAGIGSESLTENEDDIMDELTNLVNEFEHDITPSQYAAIDDDVHTENDTEFAESQPSDDDDDDNDDQNSEANGTLIRQNATLMSATDMLRNLYAMKESATDSGKIDLLNTLMASIKIIEEENLSHTKTQTKIVNYFTSK